MHHTKVLSLNGAKKYAYTKWIKNSKIKEKDKPNMNILKIEQDKSLVLEITVSGIPKKGARSLKSLDDFRDNHVFEFKDTGKNMLLYNDDMPEFDMTDFEGHVEHLTNKYGSTILPTTYELGKALDYCELLTDNSSDRAIYKE